MQKNIQKKRRNLKKSSGKKRFRPKMRFRFGVMFTIFLLSFTACFFLYMITVNINEDFFKNEFQDTIVTESTVNTSPVATATENSQSTQTEDSGDGQVPVTVSNPIPESPAVDAEYFENCCLVTDSTLNKMMSYGSFKDVFTSSDLNAVNCTSAKVESSYGTVTVYDTVKIKKPEILYLMLGSDVGSSATDDMINSVRTLVTELHSALPSMKIYVMLLPPLIYDTETATNALIDEYNQKLLSLADSLGVFCIDTNSTLKNDSGILDEKFWSYETLSLSADGYKQIVGYIQTHTV